MRVLVIDDNPDHRELMIAKLRKTYPQAEFVEIIRQTMLDDVLAAGEPVEVVLTDYRLQWSDGLKVLAQVRARYPNAPVIMVTDTGSEEVAAAGMKNGLADYVLKGHLHRLPLALKESLEKSRLRAAHEEARERLRNSEERYRIISELSSDYAYSYRIEPDGTVELDWITQAFTRITGYGSEELKSGILLPIVHPNDRALIERGRRELLAGRDYSAEIRIVTKDGQVRWLSDVARPVWDDTEKRVICVYGAGQDVTDRKRAEEERAQLIREQAARAEAEASELRYRSLAEAIPQIVWTARPDGHVDYFNRRWFEYTGLAPVENSVRDSWRGAIHPDDAHAYHERWQHSLATGEEFALECRFLRADGADRWHLCRAVPVRDADGRITKWFGTCTDIHDQKRSADAMREAQKLESIGLLAGGVAHDFNNLLTGILGNASLVLDELPLHSRLRPLLDNVLLGAERAADLTRQLLAYSGKGRFFVQRCNVSVLVREIGSLIQSSIPKKVQLRFDLAEDLPAIEIDSAQIQQLVMNLVINGAEAIGEERSGVVAVRTMLRDVDDRYIARNHFAVDGAAPGRYIAIQVRDNGCGMDESVRAHIFDPFFTTKFTGRGLGLAAALGIVRGHKGSIRIESAPGEGTLFEVLLPVASAGTEQPAQPEERVELRGAGSILVADDEELVRSLAQATLEHYGYTVLLARDGREAVEVFRRHADEVTLVLLDMMMPALSGEEALREIRAIRPGVVVIGSSGYNESMAKERFGGAGVAAFLQKPYTARILAERVKQVLEREHATRVGKP